MAAGELKTAFIIDTQLPPLMVQILFDLGYDACHTSQYLGGLLMDDKEIREIAINENRIIITKDSDFVDYYLVKGAPPKVILIALGNIKNRQLFDYLRQNVKEIQKFIDEDYKLIILQADKIIGY